ncbi:MAG: SoxR reducing system RseC family protein [Clostridiales bacterium]|nr:SoxR reducing system RseC family protein [Clostridiales bacterium]
MIRTGTVIREENQGIVVCFDQLAACAGCSGCGREQKTTTVFVRGNAKSGDRISVQMPDIKILKASMMMYLIPFLGFIFGLALGNYFSKGNDFWMIAGSFTGLLISVAGLKLADNLLGTKAAWQPKIIAVNPEIEQDDGFLCAELKRV